jgi:hypothetical protein
VKSSDEEENVVIVEIDRVHLERRRSLEARRS